VVDRPNDVVQRNPAHVLAAAPDLAAQAQPEREQHLRERPASIAQGNPHPEPHDAHPRLVRRPARRFPFLANLGQESRTGGAFLVQNLISSVPVIADRGSAHQNLGRPFKTGQGFAKQPRTLHPAASYLRFPVNRPSPAGDVLARQMDHGIQPLQSVPIHLTLLRIPSHLITVRLRPGPHQADHMVAALGQKRDQRRADEAT